MPTNTQLSQLVNAVLDDSKARDITEIDVHKLTTITDVMVICSGTSTRHVKSIAANLVKEIKTNRLGPCKIEGETDGEWVLIDIGDIIVHVMLPPTREFYDLERLWSLPMTDQTDNA